MKVEKWNTVISDCRDLYFKRLIDSNKGFFELKDENGHLFEVILTDPAPYMICSEEWLNHGVSIRDVGWTYIVKGGGFSNIFPEYLIEREVYTHYVIATHSMCLEVLASTPPRIIRVN
ncbi:hypothetical protein FE236_13205 [Mariprofundus erugo]|uniref:hypothetical protein n=1 Tax=Mariprofundus erugo TaxID=2528639 RepID=UPI0010FE6BB0|nr:hypothetical protein [Mariprofundus erugo]TLS73511.1 hypothetical protein FE236_13205 [Mariprofundus erugo]